MTIRKLIYLATALPFLCSTAQAIAQNSAFPSSSGDLPDCNQAVSVINSPQDYGKLLACRCYVALMQSSSSNSYTIDLTAPGAGSDGHVMSPWFNMSNIQGAFVVNATDNTGTNTIGIATFIQKSANSSGEGQKAVCNFFLSPIQSGVLPNGDSYINAAQTDENNYITCASSYKLVNGNQMLFFDASKTDPNCTNPLPPVTGDTAPVS